VGQREYMANCAACHGVSGKGDGPYHNELKRSATDLTTLSKRNNGVFPVARMYEVIDGGGPGHGSREMPIFGQDYKVKAAEYFVDIPYDSEAYVRMRILSLIEYLSRLQVK
jgi:mono/diheme cytochrome c family protein